MSVRPIAMLKGHFNTTDIPTETQFADLIDSIHGFKTMSDLEASGDTFAEGEIIYAEDFRFRVAPSGANDHDLTLPNGTKLYDVPIIAYVTIPAPVAVGSVDEQIFTEDTGSQVINMAPYFTGAIETFEVSGIAAVSINSSGLITVDTANAVAAVQIVVTASNDGGSDSQTFNLTIQAAEATPVITSAGTATGTGEVGSRVYVPNATFTGTGVTHSFQWTLDGVDIPGATQHNYVPKQADIGGVLARRYTVTNGVGSDTETSTTLPVVVYEKAVEFDPLYKHTNVTIGADPRQATTTSDTLAQVKTDRWFGVNAPKFYGELKFAGGSVVSASAVLGIAPFGASLAHGTGTTSAVNDFTFARLNGGVGAPTGFGDAVITAWDRTVGDSIRFCIDRSVGATGTIWFGHKGGWNGDPSAGTGGFALPDFERLVVQVGPRAFSGSNFTLLTKAADLEYAIPTGAIPMAQLFTTAESTTVAKADAMVEMIGINGHLPDRNELWGTDHWKPYISELGIRHMRTLLGTNVDAFEDANELIDTYGMKDLLVRLIPNNGGVPGTYNNTTTTNNHTFLIANLAANRILGVEGPNEFNYQNTPDNALNAYNAQKHLFSTVNGGALADKPIVGPTTWSRSLAAQDAYKAAAVADGSTVTATMDHPNLHYYMPGTRPSDGVTLEKNPLHMNRVISQIKKDTASKTMWVTEFGVRCFDGAGPAPDHQTPSASVAANYGLRGMVEFFNRGVPYVFWYGLFDDENTGDNYGLLRHDATSGQVNDLVERPMYPALKRFIALLNDPTPFTPTELRYNLTGNLSNIKYTMLQKSNGKYFLIVFNDEMTWDTVGDVERTVPDRTIKLGLAKRATSIIEHKPTFTATTATIATNAFEATLAVPDEVAVYEITIG